MPSGRGSGGHFGGGARSFSGGHFGGATRSFGGGHFGGSRRTGSSGGTRAHMPSMRWRPHTTVIFGRPVYFGAGRATATSLLTVLIVLAFFVSVLLGINWSSYEDDLSVICDDYHYYQEMAMNAQIDADYQVDGIVNRIEEYKDTGKYCIYYSFSTGVGGYTPGNSFYVYDEDTARYLKQHGVRLAVDDTYLTVSTDSVPLDYLDTALEDDAEYMEYAKMRDAWRLGTILVAGLAVAMIIAKVVISLTAKKATEEQIAETEKAKAGQSTSATAEAPNGTWRCVYCNTLNDSTKTECDGCGAGRQK